MKTKLISTILLLLMSAAGVFGDVLRVGSGAPYSTITSALATAKAGDEVWVSAGTYREAELIIPPGVSVYGGFSGSESKLTERNYTSNATILDGSGIHRVATVSGLLDGFTLRNGRTGDNGGGVLIKAGGTVSHCIAFANEAGYDGGAVFAEEGGTVKNSLLTGNRAGNDGAAISGDAGYQAVNLTVAGNDFTYKPEVKKEITVPASLTAGERLDVAEPDITNPDEVDPHGSTILVKGWELDGHSIHMPYTVTYADNGKKLRFWAANAAGVGVSNEATLTVTWTVSSDVRLLTPRAVCEGTTLAGAGITVPVFSLAPADGATYAWYIDGTPVSGLDYVLQYTDNGRLLTCEVKNGDGSITGATTPAVRLAVMKAPEILFDSKASLSIGDGEPLCLPTPVVLSNGSDLTAQGWKWTTDGGATAHDFNSCDKATAAMDGATVYYTAENACTAGTPVTKDYITTLTVNKPVGEFLQTVTALCEGMPLGDCISFDDGDNRGDYYIGNTYLSVNGSTPGSFSTLWADAKATLLAAAHHANVLRFSYNAGRDERQMMLTVHAVPAITSNPVAPVSALCAGDAHTFAVEASGDNLTYQWERSVNSTNGADGDWNNVPGATTADCHFNADAAVYYRCTVKATCADKSPAASDGKLTSAAVKVIVEKAPRITAQPISQTVCGATGIDLEVAATDADHYEWYHNGTATGTNAAKLAGVTAGGVYTCVVSKAGGVCGGVNSNPAMVTVAAVPTVSLGSSTGLTACQGDLVTLPSPEVETGGSVIVPEKTGWYLSTDAAQTPVSSFIAGNSDVTYHYKLTYKCPADADATAETVLTTTDGMPALSITVTPAPTVGGTLRDVTKNFGEKVLQSEVVNGFALTGGTAQWLLGGTPVTFGVDGYKVSAADHEKLFSCVVTNACGATATLEQSPKGKLTVNSLAIVTHPQSSTKCEGEAASLTITTENATGFQWYKDGIKKDGKVENTSNTHTLSLPAVSTADAGVYTCEVYGAGGLTLMSSPAVVTVNAKPQIVSSSQNVTVCKGSPVTLQVEAKGYDLQYSWQGITSGSSTVTVTPAATTTYTCTVKNSCKPAGETRSITVTVNTPVAITQQPKDQNECTYAAISVAATGTPTPGYKWYRNGAPAVAADLTELTKASTTPKTDGVFTCEVSNACGSVMSAAAVIRKKVALGGGTLAADHTEVCPGESATLTVKDVTGEDAQYKWTSGSAGGTVVGNSATLTVSPTSATTYFCTVSNSCGPLLPAKQVAITMTELPKTPTLTNGNSSSPDGTCEGDEVTLPVVNNKAANGYWKLNDVPKGNIEKYKVHSADDKQVFRYVNVNACGQEAVSTNTYTLNVKQPARITQVITTSPVVFKSGAALDTKVTVPAANNAVPAKSKWTLNGTQVQLTKNVALADDAARLTYSVDNGCTTGIGPGGVDETSTMVRVWDEPAFSNTGSTSYVAAGRLGFAYAYPSAPTVAMNNCTLVSQGWVCEGGNATAAFLNPAKAAEIGDNGKKIVWQVRYTIPGDNTTRYKNSPVMGTLSPWDVPTLADNTGVIYAKQGTAWTFPNANATGTNITIQPQTWVYGNTDGTDLQPMPANANYATQTKKILYRKVEYTIPGSTKTITAYLPCRILFPWREPVMDEVTPVKWDRMCNTLSYTDNGRPLTRVHCNMYECTLKEENWKAGTKVIKTTNKPNFYDDDGKAVTYNMTWVAPDGVTTGTISRTIATLETYGLPSQPILTVEPAAAGSENVQVIGVSLFSTFKITLTTPPTDRYGVCNVRYEGDRILAAGDHDKNYTINAVGTNKCGDQRGPAVAAPVNLETTSRGKAYYAAMSEGREALWEGVQGTIVREWGELWVCRVTTHNEIFQRRHMNWEQGHNAKHFTGISKRLGVPEGCVAYWVHPMDDDATHAWVRYRKADVKDTLWWELEARTSSSPSSGTRLLDILGQVTTP